MSIGNVTRPAVQMMTKKVSAPAAREAVEKAAPKAAKMVAMGLPDPKPIPAWKEALMVVVTPILLVGHVIKTSIENAFKKPGRLPGDW